MIPFTLINKLRISCHQEYTNLTFFLHYLFVPVYKQKYVIIVLYTSL
jgi:hypothetical protein